MQIEKSHLENLELIAQQVVEGYIIGLHKSPFHGFSVEFAEHRLYNTGDNLKHIDWRVFGRTDKLFVKRYEEETNLRCCIAIDTSGSMWFPDGKKEVNKLEFSAMAAASLMYILKNQLDATSLALFSDDIEYFSETRSSHSHYRLLMHELQQLIASKPNKNSTNAANCIHTIAEKIHRRSLVIIFSDMIDDDESAEEVFAALQHLKFNKHEVILFHVLDKRLELDFDFEHRPMEFVDMESGDKIKLQPNQVKEEYKQHVAKYRNLIRERCHQYRVDYVPVDLSDPVEQVLSSFLMKRNKLL
ncbi:MAG: DUF58 domain-containing protein [Chitinophagales bacterium]|nr:DUF58 domain-containing protein [Chitinophagaceae bacterium]MCB9065643.1 DUF58 domain-containing protein [Chitinophagales bacterium]